MSMQYEQGLVTEWPAIFDNPDMDYHPEMSEKQRRQCAISDSLAAWKNVHARAPMPSSFGRAMLIIIAFGAIAIAPAFIGSKCRKYLDSRKGKKEEPCLRSKLF